MFTKYQFSKDWRNPTDFPTVETNEAQVREDLQLLHEETRQALWALIDELASGGAKHIGAEQDGASVTVQALLSALLEKAHTHGDLGAVDQVIRTFSGFSVTDTLVEDDTMLPTSKAVLERMQISGMADMLRSVYDPTGKEQDIFAYADRTAETRAPMDHNHPDKAPLEHTHTAAAITGDPIPLVMGGTGAANPDDARASLGAAASSHNHAASHITSGTLGIARGGTGKASHTANAVLTGNGTSALNNVATASGAFYATSANGVPKFGILPVAQGGTGAADGATGLKNLFAAGSTVLSSHQYGTSLPTTGFTAGRIFFKKVSG